MSLRSPTVRPCLNSLRTPQGPGSEAASRPRCPIHTREKGGCDPARWFRMGKPRYKTRTARPAGRAVSSLAGVARGLRIDRLVDLFARLLGGAVGGDGVLHAL